MQDVKETHIQELKDLIRQFLSIKSNNISNGQHFGRVVDNKDPGKLGRCKVRVEVFDGLPDSDLPWAVPDQTFVGSLVGNFVVPEIGSLVKVYFYDEDINLPHYTTKVVDRNNLSSLKDEDYPNMFILYETDNGDYLKINKKTNEFVLRHSSGTVFTINQAGNLDIDTTNSLTGTMNITARGLFTLDAPFVQTPNGIVTPTGTGFLCAMPIDPLTGMPQTGSFGIRQGV